MGDIENSCQNEGGCVLLECDPCPRAGLHVSHHQLIVLPIVNYLPASSQRNIIFIRHRVATNSDFDRISNTEYYSFLGIYEYRIPNNIRSWKLTNTEYRILFGQGKFTNTEYRIVLFGLNYSNTELFEHWNGPT